MALFDSARIDKAVLESLLKRHWGFTLGDELRASQSSTFSAYDPAEQNQKYAVRATYDSDGTYLERVGGEMSFIDGIASENVAAKGCLPGLCAPVLPSLHPASKPAVFASRDGDCTVVVTPWAEGSPLDYFALKWATNECIVRACGRWLANFHSLSRIVASAHPELTRRIRRWDDLHQGVNRGAPLHPDDASVQGVAESSDGGTSRDFIVLHGDFNVGNFHVVESEDGGEPRLSVFDWDQICRGWPEMDLANAATMVAMLQEAGMPLAGEPSPLLHSGSLDLYVSTLVRGYEEVAGAGALCEARLWRMIQLRKLFYQRFTERALAEESTPEAYRTALQYNRAWLAKAPPAVEGWLPAVANS